MGSAAGGGLAVVKPGMLGEVEGAVAQRLAPGSSAQLACAGERADRGVGPTADQEQPRARATAGQ